MGEKIIHKVREWEGGWLPAGTLLADEEETEALWKPLREELMDMARSLTTPANLAMLEKFGSGMQEADSLKQVQSMAYRNIRGFEEHAKTIASEKCKELSRKWNKLLSKGSPLAATRISVYPKCNYCVETSKPTKVYLQILLYARRFAGEGPGRQYWCERVVTHVLSWNPDWLGTLDCSLDGRDKTIMSHRSDTSRKNGRDITVDSSQLAQEAPHSYLETLFSLEPEIDSTTVTYTV
ncbi:hypothetical protein HD553DRAFT_360965 [Filobasidium floriforme]|uniref:uncharacterized protein n=1 Tax=Filobasidium floriforme TaxID=5210 RepID=UPI001E8E135D|nr:uncharacterized protein HD553DRAFT_360965 [Filobasidium floriforme]KAH8080774.1 hypothetical protein HD553DRAFT_360965 [Filobasidium floriforme]